VRHQFKQAPEALLWTTSKTSLCGQLTQSDPLIRSFTRLSIDTKLRFADDGQRLAPANGETPWLLYGLAYLTCTGLRASTETAQISVTEQMIYCQMIGSYLS
jgi:hypothetical protein